MNPFTLAFREVCYRKINFLMGLFCVIIAVTTLAGSMTLLKIHDIRSQAILAYKEHDTEVMMAELKDQMRVAMLKLGLNLVILPSNQDVGEWYLDSSPDVYMPESYVDKLADSGVITVRHFLPNLQQKIKWPEMDRRIILIGTRGEVPNLHKSRRTPIVQPVPDGTIVLGWELHGNLGIELGDTIELMGRKFIVHRCHEERGSQDDITAWIPLNAGQELLGKSGMINSILALQCVCKRPDFATVRGDIVKVLPDTQVLELGTDRRLARAEARMSVGQKAKEALEKERFHRRQMRSEIELFASVLVAVVLIASCVWVGFLVMGNVRQRQTEIGILQSVGYRSISILMMFLSKTVFMTYVGAVLGVILGLFVGIQFAEKIEGVKIDGICFSELISLNLLVIVLFAAPFLTIISSSIPAIIASRQDPAMIIRQEAF